MQVLADLPHLTFLDSATAPGSVARYSYLACDPFGTYAVVDSKPVYEGVFLDGDPWETLRGLLTKYAQESIPGLPPFQGGVAGFFGYELNRTLEKLRPPDMRGRKLPEAMLHFYDVVLAYDHRLKKCWIISSGWPEQGDGRRNERARSRADELSARLGRPAPAQRAPIGAVGSWQSNFSRERYVTALQDVIELILAGDIFQANIAQRFEAALPADFDPVGFYIRLRALNPAPFAALLLYRDFVIASSSPERFIRLDGRQAETHPIKGTIARSDDPAEDRFRASFLSASEKDRAENIMIVDLLRNDLSRVCVPHSIDVPALCSLESYASVHHLVSIVTGTLAAGHDAVTLLRACFPGGSITGAPKVRAMEIINDIEGAPREAYCGAIGFIGFNGVMDSNIAIRTVIMQDGAAVFHAGGGITAMSDPDDEYDETLAKAARIFEAFGARIPGMP
jgi:para-aminobenzoate synthetase component 1